MRFIAFISILIIAFSSSESNAQKTRGFTPVFGNDAEINRTLAFITENILFDSLTYTRLATLNGYVRCTFYVDESGKVVETKISKGLASWIDYEILIAMGSLPQMEPFKNKNGELVKVKRDIYFTFNSDDQNNWPNPYGNDGDISKSIAEQRKDKLDKIAAAEKEWDDFTKDNTKISIDGKTIYKPGTLPQNPLKVTPPPARPPISITIKSE